MNIKRKGNREGEVKKGGRWRREGGGGGREGVMIYAVN